MTCRAVLRERRKRSLARSSVEAMTCRAVLRERRKEQEQKSTRSEAKCEIERARDVSVRACDVSVRESL